jgi:hypothetical protein
MVLDGVVLIGAGWEIEPWGELDIGDIAAVCNGQIC